MSTNTQSSTTNAAVDDLPVMDKARRLVCLDATWEIDALARLLPTLVKFNGKSPEEFLQVRGIGARLQSLSTLLAKACCDQSETTAALREELGLHLLNNLSEAQK